MSINKVKSYLSKDIFEHFIFSQETTWKNVLIKKLSFVKNAKLWIGSIFFIYID